MIRWKYTLLDSSDRPLDTLDGVTGGSAEIVALSPLGGSGSLSLDHRRDIDWMRHRVRVKCDTGGGFWPVGTFLLTSPTEKHTAFGVTYEVGLLTKMNVIAEDTIDRRFSLPQGHGIIRAVVDLIQATREK